MERLKHLADDKRLLTELVKTSHSNSTKEYDSLRSLVQSKENQRRKVANQLDNLIETIADCTDKTIRQVLQKKVAGLETKRASLESETLQLREKLKEKNNKVIDLSAAFSLLQAFQRDIKKQPAAVQAQVLEDIVKEILVHEDKVVLKIYGAAKLEIEHKKSPQAGELVDFGSYRIQNGRAYERKGHCLSSTPYVTELIKLSEQPGYQNPIVLRQNYLEKGLTVKEISVLHGCSPTAVKKYLRQFGIRKTEAQKVRHRSNLRYGEKLIAGKVETHKRESEVKKIIIGMYRDEKLPVTTIARLLTQMKIPTKKRGQKWDHSAVIGILKLERVYKVTRSHNK